MRVIPHQTLNKHITELLIRLDSRCNEGLLIERKPEAALCVSMCGCTLTSISTSNQFAYPAHAHKLAWLKEAHTPLAPTDHGHATEEQCHFTVHIATTTSDKVQPL
jgi:hypothetical protein